MNTKQTSRIVFLTMLIIILTACRSTASTAVPRPAGPEVPATTHTQTLSSPAACEGKFVSAKLDFANGIKARELGTYLSNGSGVALNDLDGDGRLDIIFASIDRPAAILWNEGSLKFTTQELDENLTRAVSAADVDGDGDLDLTFTKTSQQGVSFWRNEGSRQFARGDLPGVSFRAYALAWSDLTGDGRLDLVTASYNTELKQFGLSTQEIAEQGGVIVYTFANGVYVPERLTASAESLSIGLVDLNADLHQDIWIANDFVMQDDIFLRKGAGWEAAKPFATTSYSTMSIDWGDINNQPGWELFTTDMSPYDISTNNIASWLPVMAKLAQQHVQGDPQVVANALQIQDGNGKWSNYAPQMGLDATGWSWTGRFGDLDSDGYQDLYIVNGMIANNLFAHLPNSELVEENRAFRNLEGKNFELAQNWNLGSTSSGRGMVMGDLDLDGDLDIVINPLRSSAQLFENRICGGENLEVDLTWAGSLNSHALNAVVELKTDKFTLSRDVRSASGYLSGDPARLHFGFPKGTILQEMIVYWPDGAVSTIKDLHAQTLIEVIR